MINYSLTILNTSFTQSCPGEEVAKPSYGQGLKLFIDLL
jgi:hypothetical protein